MNKNYTTKNFLIAEGGQNKMKSGAELIRKERVRQIVKEGWTPEHDDQHENGEIAIAAACYAMPNDEREMGKKRYAIPDHWPWDVEYWKPTPNDRVRELVKAGALIAAEIDRLIRIEKYEEEMRRAEKKTIID